MQIGHWSFGSEYLICTGSWRYERHVLSYATNSQNLLEHDSARGVNRKMVGIFRIKLNLSRPKREVRSLHHIPNFGGTGQNWTGYHMGFSHALYRRVPRPKNQGRIRPITTPARDDLCAKVGGQCELRSRRLLGANEALS